MARWRTRQGGYQQEVFGTADDAMPAEGDRVLAFNQAVVRVRDIVSSHRADEIAAAAGPVLTVASAIAEYLEDRERRTVDKKRDGRSRLTRHVLSKPIATVPLHILTERDLTRWKAENPADLADGTVRRTVNDVKAALNRAARIHRDRLPPHIAVVIKNGLAVTEAVSPVAREAQVLADQEVRAILQAAHEVDAAEGWEGDLARLVIVLAATGARMSQVIRITVGDVLKDRILVPPSLKGRGTKRRARIAVRVGSDVLDALKPVTTGRPSNAPLLERWRSKQIGVQWVRDRRGPWTSAAELVRPWSAIREKAGLSAETVPYALRHSSIVRGLRAGLPVRLAAALHDTSSAMIETHYSAFIVDAMDDLAGAAVVPLLPQKADVFSIADKRRK